jgi:hypothetical protein
MCCCAEMQILRGQKGAHLKAHSKGVGTHELSNSEMIDWGDDEQIGRASADVSRDSGLPAMAPVATHITPISSISSGSGAGQYRSSRRPRPSSLQAASGAVEAIFVEALVACWRLSRSAAASHTLEYPGRVPQMSLPTGAACSSSSVRARPRRIIVD